jgi:hypothetical protein
MAGVNVDCIEGVELIFLAFIDMGDKFIVVHESPDFIFAFEDLELLRVH